MPPAALPAHSVLLTLKGKSVFHFGAHPVDGGNSMFSVLRFDFARSHSAHSRLSPP